MHKKGPIYREGDIMNCHNYQDILLLCTIYKIVSGSQRIEDSNVFKSYVKHFKKLIGDTGLRIIVVNDIVYHF